MQNSIAAGRRLATRLVVVQGSVTLLLGLGFLLQGWRYGLAALFGGGAVALGTALLALRSLRRRAVPAGVALLQLVAGVALKWTVFVAIFYLALVPLALPPLPLLVSAVVTLFAFVVAAGWPT